MLKNRQVNHQIKLIYLFSSCWMFLLFIPIFIPYLNKFSISMSQIFILQVAFGVTVGIFEVPSGYFCDLFGRKITILIGSFFYGLSFSFFYFSNSFQDFIFFEILMGIAFSMVSGADISLLYDWLQYKEDKRDEITKAIANMQFFHVSSESLASILGGVLVLWSFRHVALVQLFTAWFPFLVALFLKEPPFKKMEQKDHLNNIKKVFIHIFKNNRLLRLIFVNLVIWGLSTFVAVWIFQKYWLDNQIAIYYFGILWAIYNLIVGFTGKQVPALEKKYGSPTLLVLLGILPILGYFGMSVLVGWAGVFAGLCFQLSRGITQVLLKDALNWRTASEMRATVNSISSLFFRIGFAIIGPITGYCIDRWGTELTLFGLGALFLILFITVLIPLIVQVNQDETFQHQQ